MNELISIDQDKQWITVNIHGDIDHTVPEQIRAKTDLILSQPCRNLTFNLRQVKYINSFGISALIYASKKTKEKKIVFRLVNLSDEVLQTLKSLGIDHLLKEHLGG